jgi:Uma2 family endonuclease
MTAIPKRKLSEEEYLASERAAEFKSEFYDGEMFAMAGATYPHNRIKDNLARHIGNQLEGHDCVPLTSDMRVKAPRARAYMYPDIVIVCGKPEFADDKKDTLLNPVAVIEVLSPTTESFDRGGKRRRYEKIKSLKEYVLVSQDEMLCERYVRHGDNGSWLLTSFDDPSGDFALTSVPVRIPMAEIYRGVELPEPPEE